jgi:Lrp/AsnC family leucine-responsive transcriptional regulator
LITGQAADYQFKLAIKDLDTFQDLLLKRITGIPGGA